MFFRNDKLIDIIHGSHQIRFFLIEETEIDGVIPFHTLQMPDKSQENSNPAAIIVGAGRILECIIMRADNNMLGSLPKAYYNILAFNYDRVFLYAGNIFECRKYLRLRDSQAWYRVLEN